MPEACWKRGKNPDVYELFVGKDPVARITMWSRDKTEVYAYLPPAVSGRRVVDTVDEAKRVGLDLAIAQYEDGAKLLKALRELKEKQDAEG